VTNYADMVRTHLKPALGAKIISQLTVSDVNALWAEKRKAGYKPNSIRIMRAVLRAALRQAERESLVVRNVAALSDAPRQGEGRSLTVPEAKLLLDAAAGDRLEALYALTLILGLRRGEALGLSWDDLDLEGRTMVLRRQIARIRLDEGAAASTGRRTRLVLKDLKTKRSRRTLHLTPTLVAMLRSHRARQAAEQLAVGPAWVDSGLVFTTALGTPLDPDNFAHYFDRLCRKAGLGHWHPHELRHSAASIMLAQGTPLWVVSEVLGHASIAITKDVYGHLLGGEKQAATEAITDVLFSRPDEVRGSPRRSTAEDG
jgi:integrase